MPLTNIPVLDPVRIKTHPSSANLRTRTFTSVANPGVLLQRSQSRREKLDGATSLSVILLLGLGLGWPPSCQAADDHFVSRPDLIIPRVAQPPALEDFLDMKPPTTLAGRLAKAEDFIQLQPRDGEPASQSTEVYLGYDAKNLYAIFVCFDAEPQKIRARMSRREDISEDDAVVLKIDTFHDQRRAYEFRVNPHGVQSDARWTEGQGSGGLDFSFDTLWYSRARLTERGYVAWIAIPFQSLRFPSSSEQTWGVILWRVIPRVNEESTWPRVSSRIEGELNQAGILRGMANISRGRNVQLIPYGFLRSFRALDTRDPHQPQFVTESAEPDAGLDAKLVFKENFALDVALNPDFSQVESDEPQVTVNRRFEVFFPEKRPFFIENADFFRTPLNLFFTRRLSDPQLGIRLTGKTGRYAVGALLADDESPGKNVPDAAPLRGQRARFGIVRINRDIFRQSTVGMIYAERDIAGSHNRVGGLDGRLKLNPNWAATFQAVASSTEFLDGSAMAGPAYDVRLRRTGRQFNYQLGYDDLSPGFRTLTGFIPRTDIRRIRQIVEHRFRPEGDILISWGPRFNSEAVFDHSGTRLDLTHDTSLQWELVGRTEFTVLYNWDRERLRPQDFPVLPENRDFSRRRKSFAFETRYFPEVSLGGSYSVGTRINFVPAAGQEPKLASLSQGRFRVTLRPVTPLRIDNSYLLDRLTGRVRGANIFNNHIVRSKWNWQFSREFSLRVIFQYDAVLANPDLTSLAPSKNFNADFLVTYRVNPWTALFVGYNGNVQNIDLLRSRTGSGIIRTDGFRHDARQFFIKVSYLLRF